MNVLIGCEFSGAVREAFRSRGHNAWSNDILPAADGSHQHIQGDVFEALTHDKWDLAIFHPPCTYLAVSGARWWKDRQQEQHDAVDFFTKLTHTHTHTHRVGS